MFRQINGRKNSRLQKEREGKRRVNLCLNFENHFIRFKKIQTNSSWKQHVGVCDTFFVLPNRVNKQNTCESYVLSF